jgi:hypothetical protein
MLKFPRKANLYNVSKAAKGVNSVQIMNPLFELLNVGCGCSLETACVVMFATGEKLDVGREKRTCVEKEILWD